MDFDSVSLTWEEIESLQFHELSDIFPMMMQEEFDALVSDISANGLLEPIVLYEGKVLDGRNRYNACKAAIGVEPAFVELTGDMNPLEYITSMNFHRRHLSKSQAAMVAARVANMRQGERTDLVENSTKLSQSDAAGKFGVSRESVIQAKTVIEDGTLGLSRVVDQGKVAVSTAFRAAKLSETQQSAFVTEVDKGAKGQEALRQAKRIGRQEAKFPDDRYRIIYADPPWQYNDSGIVNQDNYGKAERHYQTLSIEELCKKPVESIAQKDSVLFLWTTAPLLEDSFKVISAWGFKYKAHFVWDKVKHNYGHYNSVRHELLMIATRGNCPPDIHKLFDSVQSVERTQRHSEKPKEFRKIIETLYPYGSRIELFARERVGGWDSWGDEV